MVGGNPPTPRISRLTKTMTTIKRIKWLHNPVKQEPSINIDKRITPAHIEYYGDIDKATSETVFRYIVKTEQYELLHRVIEETMRNVIKAMILEANHER